MSGARLALAALLLLVPSAGLLAGPAAKDDLPPVLIRWPLSPVPRAPAGPRPAGPRARPDSRPVPVLALRLEAPSLETELAPAPRRPPESVALARPPAPVTPRPARPVPPGPTVPRPAEPVEPRRPLQPTAPGPEPSGPVDVVAPRPAEPAAEPVPDEPGKPAAPGPRDEREVELQLPSPFLPAPRLVAELASFEIQPPTAELRHWTFPSQDLLSYEALETDKDGEWVLLRGQVDIRVADDRIQADEVRLNETTRELFAEGNVVLDHLDSRLAGSRMEYDLVTNTGTVWDVVGYTGGELNFTGERAEKLGDNKYAVYQGSFTSCTQPLPIWQVKASKAIIDVDNFVYTWNPRILFKKVPAYYLPWAAFPIKQERTTGFLIPKISNSSLRGLSIEEEFFWAVNRSVDLTFGGQYFEKYGWASTVDARWHLDGMPNPGYFEGLFINARDPDEIEGREVDERRWHGRWEHRQKLWDSWDLTFRGEAGSDQLVADEWLEDTEEAATPVFNQRLSLQRRWGKHSLNIDLENDERERPERGANLTGTDLDTGTVQRPTSISRQLPDVEYRLSGLQLGGRRWAALSMQASLAGLQEVENLEIEGSADAGARRVRFSEDTVDHSYYRADVYPQLRFPLGTSFLEVVPSVNMRASFWSRVEGDPEDVDVPVFPGDPLEDGVYTFSTTPGIDDGTLLWGWDAGLRLGGPDFQRIYRRAAGPGQRKWQHLIEPEIDLRYEPELSDEAKLISGDQVRSFYFNRFEDTRFRGTLSLVNTLRSKTVAAVGEREESARDVLIWKLSADYDFREKSVSRTLGDPMGETFMAASHWSDIRSDVNFRPTDDIRFSLRNTYDILQDDVTGTSLTGGLEGRWGYVDLAFTSRRSATTLEDSNTELTLTGEHWFYKDGRIRLGYDFTKSFNGGVEPTATTRGRSSWPYKRLVASYYNQCCGVSLSWEDVDDSAVRREREWTFIITLKNLRNFLRYRERNTTQ